LPAIKSHLLLSLLFVILSNFAVRSAIALPTHVDSAPTIGKVSVNLLIDYNGTLVWYNGTIVPSNWNFYNVTVFDTNGNIGAVFFASFGSHFVYNITGAGCPASNIFCDNAWSLWTIYGGCSLLSEVGVDQVTVSQARTVAWFLTSAATFGEVPPVGVNCSPVSIDVKPGSDPASINPTSSGTIPVAVLSSSTFDATTVVTSSLTFGHTGTEHSLVSCSVDDVNGDGLPDLICHFDARNAGFQPGDTFAILNGETSNGTLILGTDSIVVL
jgi:hypothetical protein